MLQETLEPQGYRLILGVSHDDPAVDRSYLVDMVQQRVDGIIHVPCTPAGAGFLADVPGAPPIVELLRRSDSSYGDTVVADDRHGISEITRHLIDQGHRQIALLAGWPEASTTRERIAGFEDAVREAGIEDSCVQLSRAYSVEWGSEAMRVLMERRDPPTAVVASSTQIAAGALQAAQQLNIAIPHDLSFVGFDDPPWYSATRPTITTWVDPLEEVGTVAAELLMRRLTTRDRPARGTHLLLSGSMVLRQSTCRLQAPLAGR